MPGRLQNNDGSALLLAIMVMLMLTLLFLASVKTSVVDMNIAENHKERVSAFYVAEAGLELAVRTLNDYPHVLDDDSLETLINRAPCLGKGSFQVGISRSGSDITLTAQGAQEDANAIVKVTVKRVRNRHSVWNNVICGGTGKSKQLINGNVSLHGSVHVCGDSLQALDPALVISGSGGVYNNYEGMNGTLSSRIPQLDTVTFNGEVVNTLNAKLRAERGRIDIQGSGNIGSPDVPGGSPPVKETMDGCYVADGFGGDAGVTNVFSDNGTEEGYDVEGGIDFPDLYESYTDPGSGMTYPTYLSYLQSNALVISGDLTLMPGVSFPLMSNDFGSIRMDTYGNLEISGIVYVAGNVTIQEDVSGENKGLPLLFDGKGSLVSEGNTIVNTHVLSKGVFPSDDVLGFVSAQDIEIGAGESHLSATAAFFAQGQIINYKQNQIAGAMVANYCEFYNVPDLFQVPSIVENLPPGMPGHEVSSYIYEVVDNSWCEL